MYATRIRKVCELLDGNKVTKEVLNLADRTAARYENVKQIVDKAQEEDGTWLCVQRDRLSEERAFTRACLDDMHEDGPDMVLYYLKQVQKTSRTCSKATMLLTMNSHTHICS